MKGFLLTFELARFPVEKIDCSEFGTHTTYAAIKRPTLQVFPKRLGVWHNTTARVSGHPCLAFTSAQFTLLSSLYRWRLVAARNAS